MGQPDSDHNFGQPSGSNGKRISLSDYQRRNSANQESSSKEQTKSNQPERSRQGHDEKSRNRDGSSKSSSSTEPARSRHSEQPGTSSSENREETNPNPRLTINFQWGCIQTNGQNNQPRKTVYTDPKESDKSAEKATSAETNDDNSNYLKRKIKTEKESAGQEKRARVSCGKEVILVDLTTPEVIVLDSDEESEQNAADVSNTASGSKSTPSSSSASSDDSTPKKRPATPAQFEKPRKKTHLDVRAFFDTEAIGYRSSDESSASDEGNDEILADIRENYSDILSPIKDKSKRRSVDNFSRSKSKAMPADLNQLSTSTQVPSNGNPNEDLLRNVRGIQSNLNQAPAESNGSPEDSNKRATFEFDPVSQVKLVLLKLEELKRTGYKLTLLNEKLETLGDAIFSAVKLNRDGSEACDLLVIRCVSPESSKQHKIELNSFRNPLFHCKMLYNCFLKGRDALTRENREVRKFIVYTNLEVDSENFRRKKILVNKFENDPGAVESGLRVPQDAWIFQNLILKESEIQAIGKKLLECSKKNDIKFDKVLSNCHIALINERVLKTIRKNGSSKIIGRFTDSFIRNQNLTPSARKLREYCESLFGTEFSGEKEMTFSSLFGKTDPGKQPSKRLPVEPDRKDIAEFYRKLQFCTERKDIDHLLVEKELKEFDLITDSNIINYLSNLLKSLPGRNSDICSIFKHSVSKSIVLHRMANTCDFDIDFNDRVVADFKSKLKLDDPSKIKLIETNSISLTKMKVQKVIKTIPNYSSVDCLFINFNLLKDESGSIEMCEHVSNACKLISTKILVVECDGVFRNVGNMSEINMTLKNIAKSKNVIIIGNCDGFPISIHEMSVKFEDEASGMRDLTKNAQTKLFNELGADLHDRKVRFEEIMNFESFLNFTEESNVFYQLLKISNKTLKIGNKLLNLPDYIPRVLNRRIVISKSIFKYDNKGDIFFIEGIKKSKFSEVTGLKNDKFVSFKNIDPKSKPSTNVIIHSSADNKTIHETFLKNKEIKENIHFLKYNADEFVWEKTIRLISVLLNYKTESPNIQNFDMPSEKVAVICGESGSGKRSYLLNLAKSLQNPSDCPVWTVSIDLTNDMINEMKKKDVSHNPIVHLLKMLHFNEPLEQKMFTMCYQGKIKLKSALFFGGLEVLEPENLDIVLKLIGSLRNSNLDKIYLTIPPNLRSKLESDLNLFSYTLNPLSKEDKIKILTNQWTKNLGSSYDLQKYAESLIQHYGSKDCDLTTSPQSLIMLGVIYAGSIDTKSLKSFIGRLHDDHFKLYKKYERTVTSLSDEQRKAIQKISLKRLSKPMEYSSFIKNLEKVKVLSDNSTALPDIFNHVTFLEYFAAEFLVSAIVRLPIDKDKDKLDRSEKKLVKDYCNILENIMSVSSQTFVYSFYNYYNIYHYKKIRYRVFLKFITTYGFDNTLTALLNHESDNINLEGDKGLLHTASRSGHLKIVKFLINRHNDLHKESLLRHGQIEYACKNSKLLKFINDEGEKCTSPALYAAVMNGHLEVALELLIMGADIKVLKPGFVETLAHHVASTISGLEQTKNHHRYNFVSEKLYMLSPHAIANKEEFNYPKVLNYFFVNGRRSVIETLLGEQENNAERFFENLNGKSPLNYLNASSSLKDEERLDTIKFLIEKMKIDLKTDKSNLRAILEGALRCKHNKTFKYFIDHYPDGGRIGFLKYSIIEKKFRNLEYLFNDRDMTEDKKTGNTALHIALATNADLEMISFIVQKGRINDRNNLQENPLSFALKRGVDPSVIKYLVKEGADINSKDKVGLFAWCYAIVDKRKKYSYNKEQQLDLMEFFLNVAETKAQKLPAEGKSYDFDKLKKEVEMKLEYFQNHETYDLNHCKGGPRLHQAIAQKDDLNNNWAEFLITFGANVNVKDSKGRTALQLALDAKNFYVAKILLKNKAIFDQKDPEYRDLEKSLLVADKDRDNDKNFQEVLKMLGITKS